MSNTTTTCESESEDSSGVLPQKGLPAACGASLLRMAAFLKFCTIKQNCFPSLTQHGWFILLAVTKLILFYNLRAVRKLLPLVI